MSIKPLGNDQTHQTTQHPANNAQGRSSYNTNIIKTLREAFTTLNRQLAERSQRTEQSQPSQNAQLAQDRQRAQRYRHLMQHRQNAALPETPVEHNNTTTIQHLPQDCTTKIVVISGDAPNCAKVCRGWYNAAVAAYPFILEIYRENESVRFFIPDACNLAFEAVTQTYRNVMDSTYGTHSQAKADVLQLNLQQRLALHPVLEIAKDASLVQFFQAMIWPRDDIPPKSKTLARR